MKQFILLISTLFILLSGCKSSNPVNSSENSGFALDVELIGTWKDGTFYYQFDSNGSFVENGIYKGSWVTSYDRLILLYDNYVIEEQSVYYRISSNNTLTLKFIWNDQVKNYTREL